MARGETSPLPPALARELAAYIDTTVRAAVRAARADDDPDPWTPHTRWPCASRRAACALARSGALEGVRRVGQGRGALYLVRRSALEAWIEREHARTAEAPPDDPYQRELAKRGWIAGAGKGAK
jgi:hypothetical protein